MRKIEDLLQGGKATTFEILQPGRTCGRWSATDA